MSFSLQNLQDAIDRYGDIVDGVWDNEAKWCVSIVVPAEINWINSASPIKARAARVYCNRDMAPMLEQALANVVARGLQAQLKTFDGCLCFRDVRGQPGQLSTHAYALAIDVNASTNRLGTAGDMSPELAKCFTDAGFVHGRNFRRQDPMHFSAAWERAA